MALKGLQVTQDSATLLVVDKQDILKGTALITDNRLLLASVHDAGEGLTGAATVIQKQTLKGDPYSREMARGARSGPREKPKCMEQ